MDEKEISRKQNKPLFDLEASINTIRDYLGLTQGHSITIKELDSYDDCNAYVKIQEGSGVVTSYLFKIYNGVDSSQGDFIEGLSAMLGHVYHKHNVNLSCPVISQQSHSDLHRIDCATSGNPNEKKQMLCRIFTWIEGETLSSHGSSNALFYRLGITLGNLSRNLRDFDHTSFHRDHIWDPRFLSKSHRFVEYIDDLKVREVAYNVHKEMEIISHFPTESFRWSVIMGDCNDANVIVNPQSNDIAGLIDFGDASRTFTICEIAIALAYALLSSFGLQNPQTTVASILMGYFSIDNEFSIDELKCLRLFILARLTISVSIGAYSISKDPENEYLKLHSVPGRRALLWLYSVDTESFHDCVLKVSDYCRRSSCAGELQVGDMEQLARILQTNDN